MRLSAKERKEIKDAFISTFGSGKIYLFGSRVDDTMKGGDIDLYICPESNLTDLYKRKIKFLVELDKRLGEQKVDVVIKREKERVIDQVAIRDGIEL